jgi:hypothetical protein
MKLTFRVLRRAAHALGSTRQLGCWWAELVVLGSACITGEGSIHVWVYDITVGPIASAHPIMAKTATPAQTNR